MTTIDKIMALADEYADAYGAWKETRGERREALRAALVADEARHHVPAPPEMQAAVDAALAQPDVPGGYVLVPVEPTEEMAYAGARSIIEGREKRPGVSWAEEAQMAYAAMLAAAPKGGA